MLIMKSRKIKTTEGIDFQTQERIRTIGEKENYNYLGILEGSHNQTSGNERENKKIVPKKNEKTTQY